MYIRVYVYIYIYIPICISISICIYIYIERERDIEKEIYIYRERYIALSLSLSRSIDSSVGRITLLDPEGPEFDPGLGHNWVGYEKVFTSKSAEESQTWNPTGLPDLRSPCPGIIRLAGRTAGKSPSSQSEAARRAPGALTGRTPAAEADGC